MKGLEQCLVGSTTVVIAALDVISLEEASGCGFQPEGHSELVSDGWAKGVTSRRGSLGRSLEQSDQGAECIEEGWQG